jgi:phage recombination protein Bet
MNAVANIARPQQQLGMLAKMASRYEMDAGELEHTIAATIMPPNATQAEFLALLMVASVYNLNPITKEIYAFPKKGGGIVPVVSIDGWISLVNSHPKFKGMEFEPGFSAKGDLISYTCRLWRTDREMATVVTEYLDECYRGTDPWKMKHRMLRHKALIQCARYAFGFSGIYDEDEGHAIAEVRDVAPRRQPPTAPKLIEAKPEAEGVKHDPETGEIDAGAQQETQREPEKAKPAETKQEPKPAAKSTPKAAPKVEQQQDQQADDTYNPKPILAQIQAHFDECDSEERLELVREKLVLPLLEKLTRSDQEAAKHIYNLAQERIAAADAKRVQDDQQQDEKGGAGEAIEAGGSAEDDTFPGDLPSKASAGTVKTPWEMTLEEYEAHVSAYTKAATDGEALKSQFNAEFKARERFLNDDRKRIRKIVYDRIDELNGY